MTLAIRQLLAHQSSLTGADWLTASDGLQASPAADRTGAIDPLLPVVLWKAAIRGLLPTVRSRHSIPLVQISVE
jgi:hypothetical protein